MNNYFDLRLGNCLEVLKDLQDNSIDSIVTDPPYGLSFMGKKWDYDVPSKEIWEECLRVLKPGGHLLSFAGSRTYHRMAVRIEDAGFEIRDQIMWIYGSGFPKSHNIGKAIDKNDNPEKWTNNNYGGGNYKCPDCDKWIMSGNPCKCPREVKEINNEWSGWGTALKPAHEPIVMARKPFKGNVAQNVLEWGTGAINIEESRIGMSDTDPNHRHNPSQGNSGKNSIFGVGGHNGNLKIEGRFPANVIFDEEAGKILDKQSGVSKSSGGRSGNKDGIGQNGIFGQFKGEVRDENPGLGDIGGASRFFYCPKASKKDRNEGLQGFETKQSVGGGGGIGNYLNDVNSSSGKYGSEKAPSQNHHPTIKPTDLMLYLIRLVTPKEGTTLDPFMGSGSTGKAAIRGGFKFFGIERESEYFDIAQARLDYEVEKLKSVQTKLDI